MFTMLVSANFNNSFLYVAALRFSRFHSFLWQRARSLSRFRHKKHLVSRQKSCPKYLVVSGSPILKHHLEQWSLAWWLSHQAVMPIKKKKALVTNVYLKILEKPTNIEVSSDLNLVSTETQSLAMFFCKWSQRLTLLEPIPVLLCCPQC